MVYRTINKTLIIFPFLHGLYRVLLLSKFGTFLQLSWTSVNSPTRRANFCISWADVKDLISTLADSEGEGSIIGSYRMDTADSICPSRVRAMLASRACRSSIMIGDALGRNEMQKVGTQSYISFEIYNSKLIWNYLRDGASTHMPHFLQK